MPSAPAYRDVYLKERLRKRRSAAWKKRLRDTFCPFRRMGFRFRRISRMRYCSPYEQPAQRLSNPPPLAFMRILLLFIVILSIAVLGTAVAARVSIRTEQIDMKGELLHSLQSSNPPVSELLDNHFARMARFQEHWATVCVLAVVSGFVAMVCFGLTFRETPNDNANEPNQTPAPPP